MKKIAVENIEDGMVLNRELCGAAGNILLAKGAALTSALGRRLKNWGISIVCIEGEEESTVPQNEVSISPEELKGQMQKVFSNVINNTVMKKIFIAAYQFRLKKNR